MSRVQCLECGIAVVVDPSGLCPEGHVVGSAGARIENAMGMSSPHPDEPEPWVATVELDPSDEPQATPAVRAVRPVQIVDAGEAPDAQAVGSRVPAADQEALMRELHALGELDDPAPPAAPPAPAVPQPAAPTARQDATPARATTDGSPVHQVTRDEMAEGFAELSALEAAVQAMEFDRPEESASRDEPAPSPAPAAPQAAADPAPVTGADPFDELSGLDALFGAAADETTTEPAEAPPPPARLAPATTPEATVGGEAEAPDPGPEAAHEPSTPAAPPPAQPAREPARQTGQELDITNFTARGSRVGAGKAGGRRRLFGR